MVEDLKTPRSSQREEDRATKRESCFTTTAASIAVNIKSNPPPPANHPEIGRANSLLKERKFRQCRELLLSLKKLASTKNVFLYWLYFVRAH